MGWNTQIVDNGGYIFIPFEKFKEIYPDVLDDADIRALQSMAYVFRILEEGKYEHNLSPAQVTTVNEFKSYFIKEIIRPMETYNPREGQAFGRTYNVNQFSNVVKSYFNKVYEKLLPLATFLKMQQIDFVALGNIPKGEELDEITKSLEEVSKQIGQIQEEAEGFPEAKEKIESAKETAEEWISTQAKVLEKLVETKSRELDATADKHGRRLQGIWAISAAVCAIAAYAIGLGIYHAVDLSPTTNVTVGFALLKFATVITPIIGAYICFSQYTYHRSMYDALKFRAIALSNLATLSRQYPDSKNVIFEKGIDLIFDEPRAKQSTVKFKDIQDLVKAVKG